MIDLLVPTALQRRHAKTFRDRSSSYKIDCHSDYELSKSRRASKSHQWFKSYSHFTEAVDFDYWWSFSGGGSAPAACTAGLFGMLLISNLSPKIGSRFTSFIMLGVKFDFFKKYVWQFFLKISKIYQNLMAFVVLARKE